MLHPRRWPKLVLYTPVGFVAVLPLAITFTVGWRPFIGPRARPLTDRTFAAGPNRLERGRYLVRGVTGCLACHSNVDTGVGVPLESAMTGGGKAWVPEGLPWLVAPNITPDRETGAGAWSDDTLARAIREGIGHDGRALFPIMPYPQYRQMSDEDIASIVVYLRSLPPVRNALPLTDIPFPPGPLINTVPEPLEGSVPPPDLSDPIARGQYLVRLAACSDCHSPQDAQGARIPGLDFAGGFTLRDSKGEVASANITPDPSGIPYYTEELFFQAIRTGTVVARKLNDVMPWWIYRDITDEDLKAIFAYLRTLKPIQHRVDNSLPPTDCVVCTLRHGGGVLNQARNWTAEKTVLASGTLDGTR